MNTFFVKNSQIEFKNVNIMDEDFHHIKNVLRLKENEEIYICDESLHKFEAKLKEYKNECAIFEIINEVDNSELSVDITLYQGLPKQDKMDLIVQKCTELGVSTVIPVAMNRSIVKLDAQGGTKKQQRWQKIAKEASRAVWESQNS